MIDTYLYEMEKAKQKYISEHNDQSSVNLKKYFAPKNFKVNDFEIFTSEFPININTMKETVENRIARYNEMFNVNWQINDTYSEMKKLKDSGNMFLMYTADLSKLAADILINGKKYSYSEAFFSNIRFTELVLFMKLQDIFDVQVTLTIVTQFWLEYVSWHLEND